MNDEQNTQQIGQEGNHGAGNEPLASADAPATGKDQTRPQDDYYEVDHGKKTVLSSIGDGEMHDEGLAGGTEVSTDIQSVMDRMSDEQDEAESYDREQ